MNNYLREILENLVEQDVKFIICGGVAAVLHGVERMTIDIDISLDLEHTNLERFLFFIKKMNFVPRVAIPANFILDPLKRKMMVEEKNALVFTFIDPDKPYRQIDIFLEENKSYKKLINDTVKINIDNIKINILSVEKLIDMKKDIVPPRDKDLLDIKELQAILRERKSNE